MKYKYEILALLGLIILLFVYFKYFHSNKENYNNADENLKILKESNYDDAKKYIKRQKKHFGARGQSTLEDEAYDDTIFLKVSEDKTDTNYETGELKLKKDYSSYDLPRSEYQKEVEKCQRINKLKMCSLLEGANEDGYGCGYCLDSDMIIYGNKSGPADPDNPGKFSPDVCGGGGSKNTWIPPGPNVAFECQKAKDRAYCNKMKDCGDSSVSDRCAWCPVKGKGMAKVWKDGGWHPKYDDDKCEWPYKGIKTRVKWFGFGNKRQAEKTLSVGQGDCDTDADCLPGLKCGQDPHRTQNTIGLKGSYDKIGNKQDYCYDPEFAGMNGPLVPVGECEKFGQKFPCMGPTMNTGPHSDACMKDLWRKSGCTGDVQKRLSEQGSWGSNLLKLWNKTSYTNVLNSMYGILDKSESKNYEEAKRNTKVCYGKDVDACEDRFVDEASKKERPRDCLVNLYEQAGCLPKGRLHPDNIKKSVSQDARKNYGLTKDWVTGTFYKWSPNEYKNKIRDVKQKADKLTTASNVDTYDEGIKLYENCYGKPPSESTIPMKKPCWKDFVEIMKRSHTKVTISSDEQKLVYTRDNLGVDNSFMLDTNLNRTRLAGANKVGHDWGGGKVITKANYEKPYFPFWRFVKNSRDIYQGGGDKNWKSKWPEFKKRMLTINGVSDLGDESLLCAPFMGVGRTLRNYGLAKKTSLAHMPVNGKCSSCSLVPAGQCQEGCPPSSAPNGGRNACATIGGIRNKGKKPSSCIVPNGNVITKKMWMRDDFPYWEFMRILQRYEKN